MKFAIVGWSNSVLKESYTKTLTNKTIYDDNKVSGTTKTMYAFML